jgi:outer membrane protein
MLKIKRGACFVKNPTLALSAAGIGIAAALLLAPAALAQATAAQAPAAAPVLSNAPVKIAIIQWDAALLSTKDGTAAKAELDKRLGPKGQELQKRQDDLKGLQDQLARGGSTMSDTKKADLQRQIDSGNKSLQRDAQDFQDEEQNEERKVYVELSEKMQPVVKKFAVDNGYTLLLNISDMNSPVLWAADGIDITMAVIEAYDKMVPSAPAPPKTVAPKPPATIGVKPNAPPAPPKTAPAK